MQALLSGRRCATRPLRGALRREPGIDSAGQIRQIVEAVLFQQAGRDRRAIASGTVDHDAASAWNFRKSLLEVIQGEIDTTFKVRLREFA